MICGSVFHRVVRRIQVTDNLVLIDKYLCFY